MKTNVCIIGAGVAGASMAYSLAKKGISVVVVEKNWTARETIVGELLQPGGYQELQELGLADIAENIGAVDLEGYGLFFKNEPIQIKYPAGNVGKGFHHHLFLTNLRKKIANNPLIKTIEGTVIHLIEKEDKIEGLHYTDSDGVAQTVVADLTVICDGPFSTFRAKINQAEKKVSSYFLGLILEDCQLPFPNHGHVIVADPSPILCYPISATACRMLIDFPAATPPKKSAELIAFLLEKILPQLPEAIHPSFIAAVQKAQFKVMPNHLLPAKPMQKKGAVLIGDSLNMRHPLTGGGMSVAFSDVNLFQQKINSTVFTDEKALSESIADFYVERHNKIGTINILADALYNVMSNEQLKEACYAYLKRGENYAAEPISILSAVNRNQSKLLEHFFGVAFYSAKKNMFTNNQFGLKNSFKMIKDALHIISPLLQNEQTNPVAKSFLKVTEKMM